jgi:hypothetical protein
VWVHYVDSTLSCSIAQTFVVTSPVDDRHAHRSPGWHQKISSRAYRGTILAATTAGPTLSTSGKGRHLGVVLVTGPGNGWAAILVDGKIAKTVDTGTGARRFAVVVKVTARKTGEHTIAVRALGRSGAGHGTAVMVDGLLIAP